MTTSLKLSSYSVIVRVSVVLKRTVVGDYSTNYFQRLTLESWFTNLEQTPLNRCQQLPAPYKRLINDVNKPTNSPTNNRRIETDQWLLTNSTRVFQPITSRLNRPITFNRPDFITSSTDNYSSLDSEDDYRTDSRNVSHQQQFFSELHSHGRSHYTNYWYFWVQTIYFIIKTCFNSLSYKTNRFQVAVRLFRNRS